MREGFQCLLTASENSVQEPSVAVVPRLKEKSFPGARGWGTKRPLTGEDRRAGQGWNPACGMGVSGAGLESRVRNRRQPWKTRNKEKGKNLDRKTHFAVQNEDKGTPVDREECSSDKTEEPWEGEISTVEHKDDEREGDDRNEHSLRSRGALRPARRRTELRTCIWNP